ncbi:MAG: transporter [Pseudomonadota bacterium]
MQRTLFVAALLCALPAYADMRPDSHAPIGVMGDHRHAAGEFMFSYRYMHMSMQGNQDGTDDISPETIVTTIPNRFANPPMMPPTLRVVPTEMTMDMHMFGMMYAPNDRVTLMGMVNWIDNEMDHLTFQGPAGTTELGTFTTRSSGLGDTQVSALIGLSDRWHANLGLSLPTGATDETATVLTPMNTRPSLRMPYPMQLGSGTYDVIAGLTYNDSRDTWSWGAQWQSTLRTGDNDEGYTLGDELLLTGWVAKPVGHNVSLAGRLSFRDRGDIDGIDPQIMAPIQTANPDNFGLSRIDLGVSANLVVPDTRQRLALELTVPVQQDLDGPQLETDWVVTLGWQYAP